MSYANSSIPHSAQAGVHERLHAVVRKHLEQPFRKPIMDYNRQAFGAVRWVECVQALKARGVTHVIECGPGKVLAGMTKRIDPELVGAPLYDPATLAEIKELLA